MTTNEIKTLIQNTIVGQGSQVDIGGKLAEILAAIVDTLPSVDWLVDITDVLNGGARVEIPLELYEKITASVALRSRQSSVPQTYVRAGVLPDGASLSIAAAIGVDARDFYLFGRYDLDGASFESGTGFIVYSYGGKYFIFPFEI